MKTEKNIIFLVGIPGSGKSTWARKFVSTKNQFAIILSRDSLRNMRGNYFIPSQEKMITEWMKSCFELSLNYSEDIIIDNTNLKEQYFNQFLSILNDYNDEQEKIGGNIHYNIKIKIFDTSLDDCIERNLYIRPENERVPINVVKTMYEQYINFVDNLPNFMNKNNIKFYDK